MASAHKPCYDGWESADLQEFDSVWRVDFSVHFFANGNVSVSILPVCTADGNEVEQTSNVPPSAGIEGLLTVVVTSSPVRSNPSTRMLLECLASLDVHGGLGRCRKLIMCDGFKVRQRSQRKVGIVTDEEACLYRTFVQRVASLCREHDAFKRTRVVRLARRQGSAYAIREAIGAHVTTPFVLIVPHDCLIARPVRLEALATAMHAHPRRVRYVKLVGTSTANYAGAARSQCKRCHRGALPPRRMECDLIRLSRRVCCHALRQTSCARVALHGCARCSHGQECMLPTAHAWHCAQMGWCCSQRTSLEGAWGCSRCYATWTTWRSSRCASCARISLCQARACGRGPS